MNMDDRIELDDLLSVKIPAFTTPKKTKKMLAVTTITYPGNRGLTSQNIRNYTTVHYISHLLDQYNSSTSDKNFVKIAKDFISQIDISELAPPRYGKAQSAKNYYGRLIKSNESKIESLKNEINRKEYTLNKYNSREVDRYNALIDKYNRLSATQKSNVNNYNSKVRELNNMNISSRLIASIGGGISLRPSAFKRISRNKNSPKLREVIKIKSKIKTVGKIAKSGNWIRSNPERGGSRINKLPVNSWKSSKSINGKIRYSSHSNSGDFASVTLSPNFKNWQSNISVNGSQDIVKYSKETNLIEVNHAGFANVYKGKVSSNGKRFVFSK